MHSKVAPRRRLGARIGLAAAMLLAAAVPAQAQTGNAAADGGKRICRSAVATGTIMAHRTCHTKAEWAAIDAEAERAFENRGNANTVERSQGGAGPDMDSFGQPKVPQRA